MNWKRVGRWLLWVAILNVAIFLYDEFTAKRIHAALDSILNFLFFAVIGLTLIFGVIRLSARHKTRG